MKDLLLSVIVPVYQVEDYLARCLDSILTQSFSGFELILVDDGSTDRCPEIIAAYEAQDRRVVSVRKENGGVSSARNAGMKMARGRYLIFIDSDDYIAPGLFEAAVRAAEDGGAEQVVWRYRRVDEEREYEPAFSVEDETVDVEKMGLQRFYLKYWPLSTFGVEVCNKLFRRDIVEKNGLEFLQNREDLGEDLLFNAMYQMHVHRIVSMKEPFYFYFQRRESIMHSAKPRSAYRMLDMAVRLWKYVEEQGRMQEMRNVLPVMCLCMLILKGIRSEPNLEDVYTVMKAFGQNKTMRVILKRLLLPMPLTLYTLKLHRDYSLNLWGRQFALRWLRGDIPGAAALARK